MYIKLIYPKMSRRPMDTDLKLRMSPPLGLYTIANMFRDKHKVVVVNENIEPINYDDGPDIVGISMSLDAYPRAVEISKRFREKGIKVVGGGIHVTTAPEFISNNVFDTLCIGPAELTWPQIIKDVQQGVLKQRYTCTRPIKSEEIVGPAYDLIRKNEEYLFCNVMHASRGCPFRCDFCYNSSLNRSYVARPISSILQEIRQMGRKHILLIDDNIFGSSKWLKEFLAAVKPLKIKWHCAISINIAEHPKLLDEMYASGCRGMFIGFESISPDSINSVHKVQNHTTTYEDAIEAIHSRGIMINGSFVFGLDSDTPKTFRATLDWIVKNKIETVTSHILTPYPGTRLYKQMEEEGRITSNDLSLYNTAHVVFKPLHLTPDQLYDGYLWMYEQVYSFKNILRRIPKSREQIIPYLLFNLVYRKFGKWTDKLCKIITYKRLGKIVETLSGC